MLELSGSYLLSGILLLAVGHVWRSNSEGRKKLYEKAEDHGTRIAVMEAERTGMQKDIGEIKQDVKHILQRLPQGGK